MCVWREVCCLLQVLGVIQVPLALIHAQLRGAHTGVQPKDSTNYIGAATIVGTEFATETVPQLFTDNEHDAAAALYFLGSFPLSSAFQSPNASCLNLGTSAGRFGLTERLNYGETRVQEIQVILLATKPFWTGRAERLNYGETRVREIQVILLATKPFWTGRDALYGLKRNYLRQAPGARDWCRKLHDDEGGYFRSCVLELCPVTGRCNFVLLLVNALPFGETGSVTAPFEKFHIHLVSWSCRFTPSGRRPMMITPCWVFWNVLQTLYKERDAFLTFTVLGILECAPNASQGAGCLFDFLGVVFAREGQTINFSVLPGPTKSRRAELSGTVADLLNQGAFSSQCVESPHGRQLWTNFWVADIPILFSITRRISGRSSRGFTFGPRVEIDLEEVVGTSSRHVNP